MVAPRALVFRPLVKGNEALGTRLPLPWIENDYIEHAPGLATEPSHVMFVTRDEIKPFTQTVTQTNIDKPRLG